MVSQGEDRQRAKSRLLKKPLDEGGMRWLLEVRTENRGVGSSRMGEVVLRGAMSGQLTISLNETDGA